jgi:hypothetical protein
MREIPSFEKEIPSFPRLVVPCHKKGGIPNLTPFGRSGKQQGPCETTPFFVKKERYRHALTGHAMLG